MRNTLGRALGLGAVAAVVALALMGADTPRPKGAMTATKLDEVLGNLAEAEGNDLRVEGVGLVVGLDNTGFNPPPSAERQKLVDEMRKARVDQAEKLLDSRRVALVLVHAVIPPGATKPDPLDVQVEIPAASITPETSLAGGHLIVTRLTEVGYAGGELRQGHFLATAGGPVMIGNDARPDDKNIGRVLGGCRVRNEVPYLLLLKEGHQNARTAKQVGDVIKRRFHQLEGVTEKGLADPKSDKHLVLKVPRVYHQNQARYFRVLKLLPIVDTIPELQAERMKRWGQELLDPKAAGVAALRLEGLGKPAIGVLKAGLASPDAQVRFFAAESLAYLDDPSGVDVLSRATRTLPDFRAHALAALAAMDHPAALLRLRQLMGEADPQVRYGAFNSLRTLDARDPFLGQVRVLRDEPAPAGADDAEGMALAIGEAPHRRRPVPRKEDPFALYVVDCEGPPMVHVSRTRRSEVVVFGRGQKLLTPVVLGGPTSLLLNAAEGDDSVQISRIESRGPEDPDVKVACPLELGEVIREAAQLGASYPEILAILRGADRQKNLPGPLLIDAAPAPGTAYLDAQLSGNAKKDDAVGRAGFAPEGRRPSRIRNMLRRGKDKDRTPAKD